MEFAKTAGDGSRPPFRAGFHSGPVRGQFIPDPKARLLDQVRDLMRVRHAVSQAR